jgi:hypothetical protein
MSERRIPSLFRLWCDLSFYAPLGFALEARRLVPEMVARGRQQVANARVLGQFALPRLQSGAADLAGKIAGDVVAARGRRADKVDVPGGEAVGHRDAFDGDASERWVPQGVEEQSIPVRQEGGSTVSTADPSFAGGGPVAPMPASSVDSGANAAAGLAIPDYDSLAASQVVPRLDGLTADELEAVRTYEQVHRGRRTILAKVEQLQDPAGDEAQWGSDAAVPPDGGSAGG